MSESQEESGIATVLRYDEASYEELPEIKLERINALLDPKKVLWIRIKGQVRPQAIEIIGAWSGLDKLDKNTILEYEEGSPRLIQFGDCTFLSWRYIESAHSKMEERVIQIIVGDGFVVTFEQNPEDLDGVKGLLLKETRIRKLPASYLLYSLLSATMDDFFGHTKYLAERVDELQEEIVGTSREVVDEVLQLRTELSSLWISVWYLKDTVSALRDRRSSISDGTVKHDFEDLANRIDLLTQMIDSTRQVIPQVIALYQNDLANQLNKIIRVLTVITIIFTPPTVIATWYGMNFKNIPEVQAVYGYPAILLVTVGICLILTWYFWRKKWIRF